MGRNDREKLSVPKLAPGICCERGCWASLGCLLETGASLSGLINRGVSIASLALCFRGLSQASVPLILLPLFIYIMPKAGLPKLHGLQGSTEQRCVISLVWRGGCLLTHALSGSFRLLPAALRASCFCRGRVSHVRVILALLSSVPMPLCMCRCGCK